MSERQGAIYFGEADTGFTYGYVAGQVKDTEVFVGGTKARPMILSYTDDGDGPECWLDDITLFFPDDTVRLTTLDQLQAELSKDDYGRLCDWMYEVAQAHSIDSAADKADHMRELLEDSRREQLS